MHHLVMPTTLSCVLCLYRSFLFAPPTPVTMGNQGTSNTSAIIYNRHPTATFCAVLKSTSLSTVFNNYTTLIKHILSYGFILFPRENTMKTVIMFPH